MKTAMQFLLEKIENGDFLDHPKVIGEFIKYNLLEKEKEQIMDVYWDGGQDVPTHQNTVEEYYNETYGGNK